MTGDRVSAIAEQAAQPEDLELGHDRPPPISTTSSTEKTIPKEERRHDQSHDEVLDDEEEEEEDVPYNISDRHLPWLLRPTPNKQIEGHPKKGPSYWVAERLLTRTWLGLFYDLAFIATLSAFTEQHPISSWSTLANFFGFFVLLWWGWYAQVHYDVHFETEDTVHRLFKLFQLTGLGYLSGATGGWDLSKIRLQSDPFAEDAGVRSQANISFVTVAAAWAGLRLLLLVQYIMVLRLAKKAKRKDYKSFYMPIAYYTLSCVIAIIAASITSTTRALAAVNIACLFLAVSVEIVGVVVSGSRGSSAMLSNGPRLVERLGGLTLIVLGEGFLGVFKGYNRAILGFSRDNINVYISVFCCIVLLWCMFDFIFTGHQTRFRMSRTRMSIWTILHFPVHFFIFAFVSGLTNITVSSAFIDGALYLQESFLVPAVTAVSSNSTVLIDLLDDKDLALQLATLKLTPTYREELSILANRTDINLGVQISQYAAQILDQSASIYIAGDSDESYQEPYFELLSISVEQTNDTALMEMRTDQAAELYLKIWTNLVNSLFQGIGWTFPAAGLTLISISVLHITQYHGQPGHALRTLEYSQSFAGLALSLLGLLNLGKPRIELADLLSDSNGSNISPIYVLMASNWLIPTITLVYFFLMVGQKITLLLRARRARKGDRMRDQATSRS